MIKLLYKFLERAAETQTFSLLHREQLQDVSVWVTKVHAPSATSMVDLHIVQGVEWPAPVAEAFRLDTREDRIELLFAHLERIVVDLELRAIVEIQRQ